MEGEPMGDGLTPTDSEAVTRAIRLLDEAGYTVSEASKAKSTEDGVAFTLDIKAPTRYQDWESGGLLGGEDDG